MVKFLKPGKVVVILSGRYAGKKAVIIKNFDEGTQQRPYPHAIVAGIERSPLKITRGMDKKKVEKRSRVKPFIKVINYNHMMPTRYSLEGDFKSSVSTDSFADKTQRVEAKKSLRVVFEEKYRSGKNKWFFEKLRF